MMLTKLKKQYLLFNYAISFFSRIPIAKTTDFSAYPFHLSNAYFPAVGAIYALLVSIVFMLSDSVLGESVVSIILMLVAGLLLTGALHEDGVADACDGFGGGYNKKQYLAIMKDSHIGTYGVLGLIALFSLKVSLLSQLSTQGYVAFFSVIFCASVFSRFSALLLMQYSEYARDDESSKSSASSQRLPAQYLCVAFITALFSLLLMPNMLILMMIIVVSLSTYLCKRYFDNKIGGYTGDCLGFLQQLNEVLILLMSLAWWHSLS